MEKIFYVTTPIYYINGLPHIGHSYTTIAADVLARHKRARGYRVLFLTGTDEHGQKVLRVAQEKGVSPQAYADGMIAHFTGAWNKLNISYDDFIRTTQERHKTTVAYVLSTLQAQGDLYLGYYEGLYCVPCEVFWTPAQAVNQGCPDCGRPLETIQESNYFFRLSKYQDWLLTYLKEHPGCVRPASRYNEVMSFLTESPLNDLCVSRPAARLSWGIPFPFSPDHVTYVWFDALINYISALGYPLDKEKVAVFWPHAIHLIGKDILRQHAVFWPIMLKALGLDPPRCVFAHGWWQVGQEKMSKSLGNVVNPLDVIEEFGLDVYRYFLLREVPFGLDGVFSRESVIKRFNGDLANDLGNLVFRTLTMAEKYFDGRIPGPAADDKGSDIGRQIDARLAALSEAVDRALEEFDFIRALEAIWEVIGLANKYIEETKPWVLKKQNQIPALESFMARLIGVLRVVAVEIRPFMPQTADKMLEQIKEDHVEKGTPLFPRIMSE